LPTKEYEQSAFEFIQEFYEHSSEINGEGGLGWFLENSTYTERLAKVYKDLDIANVSEGRVPAFTYFYVREEDDKVIGMINVRLALNDFLREQGGHMGYSIRPTERGRGYGTQMLREALAFCKAIGLHEVVITCDKINIVSAGIIKNCGGVLEAEFYSDFFKEVIQRYKVSS